MFNNLKIRYIIIFKETNKIIILIRRQSRAVISRCGRFHSINDTEYSGRWQLASWLTRDVLRLNDNLIKIVTYHTIDEIRFSFILCLIKLMFLLVLLKNASEYRLFWDCSNDIIFIYCLWMIFNIKNWIETK